jgi:hypothetical protein
MNLDWGAETVADITSKLGSPPAVVVSFVSFPLTADDVTNLQAAANQARDAGAVLVVTLQPWGGLSSVTDQATADVAQRLAAFGTQGVATIVRFAHEMNGTWYPWSQDPAAYVAAFRRVAEAVHAMAPTAANDVGPQPGRGLPVRGWTVRGEAGQPGGKGARHQWERAPRSRRRPVRSLLAGRRLRGLGRDEPLPLGNHVSVGSQHGPAAGKFAEMISGSPVAGRVAVPDFYTGYAERYGKPLAIVETAALYRPGGGGAAETAIKTAWLAQVFSSVTRARFPLLRMVNWFDWRKLETEVNAVVDWRVTANPAVRSAFLAAMTNGFHLGPAVPNAAAVETCSQP